MAAQPTRTAEQWSEPQRPLPRDRSGDDDGRSRLIGGRIEGIDLARGLAMVGMTVTHFVLVAPGSRAVGALIAEGLSGRAMPLFVLLGGIGVTMLSARSATPDRDLAIRAVMLMALGLVLTEYIDRLAIVLQSYGLFFVVAMGLRRLPSPALAAAVPAIVAIGSFTYQTVGSPPRTTPYGELFSSSGVRSLVVDGHYPLFPVGAFFVLGMLLGRIDLRSDRVAAVMAAVGAVVGIGTVVVADAVARTFDLTREFGGRGGDGTFHPTRVLDVSGHSSMPAWVISAAGTSVAVLGLSLLVARRWPRSFKPLIAVGALALTYYVFQAWMTQVVTDWTDTTLGQEWTTVLLVLAGFAVFAMVWKRWLGSGPFERVLRLGSGPRRLTPVLGGEPPSG